AVATAAARAVATHLAESIAASGQASLSLTGGSVGVATAAALARHEVDWDRVTIYFGDERFVPPTIPSAMTASSIPHCSRGSAGAPPSTGGRPEPGTTTTSTTRPPGSAPPSRPRRTTPRCST